MALPLMLMVAPSGSTKAEVAFLRPSSFSQTSMLTGRVAMEDAVDSATACGFFIADMKRPSGTSEPNLTTSG